MIGSSPWRRRATANRTGSGGGVGAAAAHTVGCQHALRQPRTAAGIERSRCRCLGSCRGSVAPKMRLRRHVNRTCDCSLGLRRGRGCEGAGGFKQRNVGVGTRCVLEKAAGGVIRNFNKPVAPVRHRALRIAPIHRQVTNNAGLLFAHR